MPDAVVENLVDITDVAHFVVEAVLLEAEVANCPMVVYSLILDMTSLALDQSKRRSQTGASIEHKKEKEEEVDDEEEGSQEELKQG